MRLRPLAAYAACAVLLSMGFATLLSAPANAQVKPEGPQYASVIRVPGGSVDCTSGCTFTDLGNGFEIDTGDGNSYFDDGTNLFGAP
jgi:hypothetical protein